MIKLLYFAALVDKLGLASEEIDLSGQVSDIRGLITALKQRGGAWEEIFGNGTLRITVNKQFSEITTPIKHGDEVAFISAWL